MAIVQNPLIGVTRKKVGNIVFYRSHNKNIIRSSPINYTDAKVESQLRNRYIFHCAVQSVANSLPLFKYLNFHRLIFHNSTSVYGLMMKKIKLMLMYDSVPGADILDHCFFNLDNFTFGPGEIPCPQIDLASFNPGNLFDIGWNMEEVGNTIEGSWLMFHMFINLSKKISYTSMIGTPVEEGKTSGNLPPYFEPGDRIHFISFCYDGENFKTSLSSFLNDPEFILP